MSKIEKLISRFETAKNDFTWKELCRLLEGIGYAEVQGAGSRVKFDNGNPDQRVNLHRPHPGNKVKVYIVRELRRNLKEWRMI